MVKHSSYRNWQALTEKKHFIRHIYSIFSICKPYNFIHTSKPLHRLMHHAQKQHWNIKQKMIVNRYKIGASYIESYVQTIQSNWGEGVGWRRYCSFPWQSKRNKSKHFVNAWGYAVLYSRRETRTNNSRFKLQHTKKTLDPEKGAQSRGEKFTEAGKQNFRIQEKKTICWLYGSMCMKLDDDCHSYEISCTNFGGFGRLPRCTFFLEYLHFFLRVRYFVLVLDKPKILFFENGS